jgi:hypothetical protein
VYSVKFSAHEINVFHALGTSEQYSFGQLRLNKKNFNQGANILTKYFCKKCTTYFKGLIVKLSRDTDLFGAVKTLQFDRVVCFDKAIVKWTFIKFALFRVYFLVSRAIERLIVDIKW